ncbi:hypothetical protein FGLOB1_13164 [Fusarium globosum]|uniref:DUF7908 domain-containing protein n=1 Tax=Fusarium globosum TaxID=78864 RepID=A0A8H6CXT3_9HYPO|nr:hypothetical protein FGLOB1_13164 [Fusarium globosum]
MKSHIFFAVLLKGIAALPEQDLAPREAETYCVTYLSTYLAAIPNDDGAFSSINGDANEPEGEDKEAGRFPLAPSIRPTFGRNNSIATTSTNSAPSLIDEETSQLAEFVPGSTSGDVPMSSEPPTSQSAFQTSFGQTTLASPTTTGIIEPEGQAVILLIQLPDDDQKRRLNKREVGRFVGDGSPDTCTSASTFNLAQGQLFKNGNPIFYSGEEFKQLEGQGAPPSDAVTKGFASTGTSLSFRNEELPNGEAGFCQISNGQVYVTFSSTPPACKPVTLGVYDVSQCQNGKLVGIDDSSSSSPTTAAQESSIVSKEATTLSSEAVEPSTSSFGVTTIQPRLTSTDGTLSSIEEVASTTSLEVDDSTSESSVMPISESSSSELAESTTTLATLRASSEGTTTASEGTTTESVDDTSLQTTSNQPSNEVSTTADETIVQTATTPETPCVAGITSAGGSPPLQDRISDCEEFNVVTVSPSEIIVTTFKKRWEYRIPTGWPTARPTNRQLVRRQVPEATTIFPSETPAYATYCDSAEEYYDACSSAGVTAMTTTLITPTETETSEEPACRAASIVKRAGEGLGYQFEDDWDVIRMPGWRYF